MFVEELRLRVEHYFKIVVYTVRVSLSNNSGRHSQEHRIFPGQAFSGQHPVRPVQRGDEAAGDDRGVGRGARDNPTARDYQEDAGGIAKGSDDHPKGP